VTKQFLERSLERVLVFRPAAGPPIREAKDTVNTDFFTQLVTPSARSRVLRHREIREQTFPITEVIHPRDGTHNVGNLHWGDST